MIKTAITFIFLFFANALVWAQGSGDSLAQFMDTASTVSKIDYYYEHGRNIEDIFADSARRAYQSGIALSKTSKDQKSLMDGWTELGYFYRKQFEDSSVYYFKKALVLADSFSYVHDQQRIRFNLASHFENKQDALRSLKWSLDALEYAYLKGDSLTLADNYLQIGRLNDVMGNQEGALPYYLDAYRIYTNEGDDFYAAAVLGNIGLVYKKSGNNEFAIRYFNKSMKYYLDDEDRFSATAAMTNLGLTYKEQGELRKADSILLEVLNIINGKTEYEFYSSSAYHNVGAVRLEQGKLQEALEYFDLAEKVMKKFNLKWAFSNNQLYKSKAYLALGKLKIAERLALESYNSSSAYNFLDQQLEAAAFLVDYYKLDNQFDQALKFLELSNELKKLKDQQLQEARLYQFEINEKLKDKEQELQALVKENTINELKAETERKSRIWLTIGIIALALILFILVFYYRKNLTLSKALFVKNKMILDQARLLEEANELKGRFFANISHELRTPLTLIKGMIHTLIQDEDKKNHQRLDVAMRNSNQLESMIDELLELSRMEVNTIEVNLESNYAKPLLDRIVNSFSSLAYQYDLELEVDNRLPEDLVFDIETRKLEKILNNLLFNAIKFSPKGDKVKVIMDTHAELLLLTINNNGNTISTDLLPHVFDRFFQTKREHSADGLGLGLSIVKELTELMNGQVSVESTESTGTTFSLSFDARREELPEVSESQEIVKIDLTTFGKPKILIVEDHAEMRAYLADILEENFKIDKAINGKEALEHLETAKYDLIITDLMMPEMDGFELVDYLKKSAKFKQTPLVVLTARGADADRLNLLSLGIDDYITKPFNPDELRVRLFNIFENLRERVKWNKIQQPEPDVQETEHGLISQLEEFISERMSGASLSVNELARHVAMSERQLYRKLGELTGLTPANLIKEVKLKFAMQLAQNKKYAKVDALAKAVGFESAAYFSKQFYQRFGKRPTEYLT